MSNKKEDARYLPDAELDIMKAVWREGRELGASDILISLGNKRSWTRATLHVLLGRLCDKGYLDADKSGYVYKYTALVSENEYKSLESESFLRRIYDGSAKNMVASLIEGDAMTEGDIAELEAILKARKR